MQPLMLHEDPVSGNCYNIKLIASILSRLMESRVYHVVNGDTRTPRLLKEVSAYGKISVLQTGASTFLPEPNAACWYLADAAQSSNVVPSYLLQRAGMLRWMFSEHHQHEVNIAALGSWLKYIGKEKLDESQKAQLEGKKAANRAILDSMDEHLAKSKSGWFVGKDLTLADIVLYGYVHVAHHARFDLREWPAIDSWCDKVTTVDGFIPMDVDS